MNPPQLHPLRKPRTRPVLSSALLAFAGLFGALPDISAAPAAAKNISARGEDLLTLDNGTVKIGIDRAKGAAIKWLSWSAYPKNMVNSADPGRLIQQSYYAGLRLDRTTEGQSKSWSPWSWNPIQGGGVASRRCSWGAGGRHSWLRGRRWRSQCQWGSEPGWPPLKCLCSNYFKVLIALDTTMTSKMSMAED